MLVNREKNLNTHFYSEKNNPIKKYAKITAIFLTILSACAITTIVITFHFGGLTPVAASLALKISTTSLIVLLGLQTWPLVTPLLPNKLRLVANYIQVMVTEFFSVLFLAIIFPTNLEKKDPKTADECNPNQTPILLIHGFLGSSNNWVYHKSRLKKAGFDNIFVINLGNPLHSIDQYTDLVSAKINQIKAITGRNDIHLIGHSMGGLVARQYLYRHANSEKIRVKKIITLGTPLNGTWAAYLLSWLSRAANQMTKNSAFVTAQQEVANKDKKTKYLHIGTKTEAVVIPYSSSITSDGPQKKSKLLDATGHIGFLFSDRAANYILEELKPDLPPINI